MADIHQTISLGIGSPADIPHFILFGLSVNANPALFQRATSTGLISGAGRRSIAAGSTKRRLKTPGVQRHVKAGE
jgi:hypothetical protein